jgi:hypothetical protein
VESPDLATHDLLEPFQKLEPVRAFIQSVDNEIGAMKLA